MKSNKKTKKNIETDGRKSTQSHAWYALRRTLPPWSFEKNLSELINCLHLYRIDEVIVKVDVEEFFHGQVPLVWLKKYQEKLFAAKQGIEKAGALFSINPWITQGHVDRGRNAADEVPGIVTTVGHDGAVSTCCACPLSDAWHAHTEKAWTIYAETKPHILWVEDDIRTFNHGPVHWGCFCELHVKKFSDRIGERVTREKLVAAILQSGEPHPWRAQYFDMQAEVMIDTAAFLAKTVHRTSPETSLGLMSSGPDNHCVEGRNWHGFAHALGDGKPLYSRPPLGSYSETSLRELAYSSHSIKITRAALPPGVIEQSEVENHTFTRYSKSTVFTFLQMSLSYALGTQGVTMNLFDHLGGDMEAMPEFGRMLGEKKDFLNALAMVTQQPGTYRGIRLLHRDTNSYKKVLTAGSDYPDLREDGLTGSMTLTWLGLASTYGDGAALESETITAAFGQNIAGFSDEEITRMLKKGMFIDGQCAHTLFSRGFGPLIGITSINAPEKIEKFGPVSAEEFFNTDFGGKERMYLTLLIGPAHMPEAAAVQIDPKAKIISSMVDADGVRRAPALFYFENSLGGRVAVQTLEMDSAHGPGYCKPFRQKMLHEVFRQLGGGTSPLSVWTDGAYPLVIRKDFTHLRLPDITDDTSACGGQTAPFDNGAVFLAFFNLCLDPWEEINARLSLKGVPEKIFTLNSDGVWIEDTACECSYIGQELHLRCKKTVTFAEPLFLLLTRAMDM